VEKLSVMNETLGDRILQLRKNAGLTQTELAEKIGVSKSQYLRYENKNVQPPANIMNLLAEHLGTSVDYLINGDKTEKAKANIKNADLLQKFKEVDALPEDEQSVIVKVISAYVRDFRAKQAYAS
jgi:transcriptional regulator with XRE-family HTH domain